MLFEVTFFLILISIMFTFNYRESLKIKKYKMSLNAANPIILNSNITTRESEIIELLYEGYTNNKIADELYISKRTVDRHVYNVYKKLNVENRVQLFKLFASPVTSNE